MVKSAFEDQRDEIRVDEAIMDEPKTLIVGGGISGLSTAWWLAEQGMGVELWERSPRPGGKIHTRREAGYTTEQAAGLVMNFRPEIDRLIGATGLSNHKRSRSRQMRRYLVHRGKLTEVPLQIGAMVRSPIWSRSCKLRLLTEILVPKGGDPRETVSEFITRRLGREILETAMDPFVSGTLACEPDLANAQTVLPRLTELERRYGSLTLGMLVNRLLRRRRANVAEAFSFTQGMSQLTDRLAAAPGLRLRKDCEVRAVQPVANAWQVTAGTRAGEITRNFAQVVLSPPAEVAARLLYPLDPGLARLLQGIDYAPLAVVHLGLDRQAIRHPLDGTGFLVPRREDLAFNGNLWMSSLFPERAPAGKVLLTSYLGGARHPARATWTEERMMDSILADLRRLLGVRGTPEYVRVDRHARALPLYHGAYAERLSAIEARLTCWPGLYLNANYLGGISVRERIFQGLQTATRIARDSEREAATLVTVKRRAMATAR